MVNTYLLYLQPCTHHELLVKCKVDKIMGLNQLGSCSCSVTVNTAMENLGVFIASILLFPALAQAQLPNGACSYEDVTCAITGDNLVGLVEGVSSAEECRLICEETTGAR